MNIESIYQQLSEMNGYMSSEEFSQEYLHKTKSYYRTVRARGVSMNSEVLITLMEQLAIKADGLRHHNQNKMLHHKAHQYDELAKQVGKELAKRAINQKANMRVRKMLVDIVNELNTKRDENTSSRFDYPPILIC